VTHALKFLAWVILDAKPFATTDSPRFREFMADFGYKPPSSRQLLRYLGPLQETVDSIIRTKLSKLEFVSVAVDEWSAANMISFLSLAYQGFDDDMKLAQCEDLIKFPHPHTAESYESHIRRRLNFRTTNDVILTSLTADGARVIQNACASITGSADTIWCLAHQIQLAVNDVLQAPSNPYKPTIAKVRQWVLAIRSHQLPRDALAVEEQLASVKQQQLVLDVATRWVSALLMIETFLKLWPIVSAMADKGVLDNFIAGELNITDTEVAQSRAAEGVLQGFAAITHASGAKKYSTIVYVPMMIVQLRQKLEASAATDTFLNVQFKALLREAFMSRMKPIMERPSLQLLAALLDPLRHDLPFLRGNDRLIEAVNAEMVEQMVLLNPSRRLANGEIVAAATPEQCRTELEEYHTMCTVNAEAFKNMLKAETPWSAEAHAKLCR